MVFISDEQHSNEERGKIIFQPSVHDSGESRPRGWEKMLKTPGEVQPPPALGTLSVPFHQGNETQ